MIRKSKPHKCAVKTCKKSFMQSRPLQRVCSWECSLVAGREKTLKDDRKETKLKLEKLEPLDYWLKKAERAFNAYIRARDAHLPCISCGRTDATVWNAGHYISVGANRTLRFHEDNVHKQCARPCNKDQGGASVKYRIGLRAKIGDERVEWLEGWHPPNKLTREDVQAIEAKYKLKLKELIAQS